ncbi:MAG: S8 family serine peptidase [bacterium]|nr:S8 family serine peptidase [bacterium]
MSKTYGVVFLVMIGVLFILPSMGIAQARGGTVPRFSDLPVVDPDLLDTGRGMVRVLIFLDYLPHEVIAEQVAARHVAEYQALASQVNGIVERYAGARQLDAARDADNYASMLGMKPKDQQALRELNEQREALSLTVKAEVTEVLRTELEAYRTPVVKALEQLGAEVEFTTIAGNAIVAMAPRHVLRDAAAIAGVGRIEADRLFHSQLDIAADATLVTSSATGGSLWDNGFTGGVFEPAIVDTGTDRTHPGLADTGARTNFWSWYLTAGIGDPSYDPTENSYLQDDLEGHGSHVFGIVASYGTPLHTTYLGMAHGVGKTVTLKAAWSNTSTGGASMYRSDQMMVVDRALYRVEELYPIYGVDTFQDDVDGFNLSYSGETASDDTGSGRFWDSVVSSFGTGYETPFTVAAGNSGPGNVNFSDPAVSYNGITVANAYDQGTASRSDDTVQSSSTRGPTAGGRRKPDITAPGSFIYSANQNWESERDYVFGTGTSMAAPMVLGVAMDLMDAGVWREPEIKALLINTAQKNEPGFAFEGDADGWSTAAGWGYMNAWAAYYHRSDVRTATLAPRGSAGDYRLYKGQMRDEGSFGEGRDRATMVWHRHATYNPGSYPTTYYSLSDLDLVLYNETTGAFIDGDTTAPDNVHQVRIPSAAAMTDVVVKAMASSTSFPHGGATESFSLATEEGFTEVNFPGTGPAYAIWPSTMNVNEEADFEFWIRNDGDVASHGNTFDVILPSGWTRVSGSDPFDAGSIPGSGTNSIHVTWRLRAPSTAQSTVITAAHSHASYGLSLGPANWGMPVTVSVSDTIFADGFESGDTSSWSSTVP